MRAELLIFDLDGTLIDSTNDITTAVNRTLAELALPPRRPEEVRELVGDGATVLMARAVPESLHARLDELVARFREHYARVSTVETLAYDGVPEMIAALEGVAMALASNKPSAFLEGILARFGWSGRFDPVLGGDSLPTHKPDPAPLLLCCERRGVAPERAIMVGDGAQDIEAAHAAGMMSCAVTWGFRPRALLEELGPTWMIDAPGELVGLVRA